MGNRKTHEEFIKEIISVYGNEYEILDTYKTAKTKIRFKHTCGNILEKTPSCIKSSGMTCRVCTKINYVYNPKVAESRVRNKSKEFYTRFGELSDGKYQLLSEYKGTKRHISIKCLTCNNINKQRAGDFLNGKRCKICSVGKRASKRIKNVTSSFEKKLENKYGDKINLIGEYQGAKINTEFLCNTCYNKFTTTPCSIVNKRVTFGCPICGHSSSGENRIREYLDKKEVNYEMEYSFSDLAFKNKLKFDFAIFLDGNTKCPSLLVEYDGQQHFQPVEYFGGEKALRETQFRDRMKDKYCVRKEIELVRIPYWDYENIEIILEQKVSHS